MKSSCRLLFSWNKITINIEQLLTLSLLISGGHIPPYGSWDSHPKTSQRREAHPAPSTIFRAAFFFKKNPFCNQRDIPILICMYIYIYIMYIYIYNVYIYIYCIYLHIYIYLLLVIRLYTNSPAQNLHFVFWFPIQRMMTPLGPVRSPWRLECHWVAGKTQPGNHGFDPQIGWALLLVFSFNEVWKCPLFI